MDSGVPAKCGEECTMVSKIFKAGVADGINKCLDTVPDPTVEGACYEKLAPCVAESVAQACEDDTAADFCSTVLATCDDAGAVPTQDECVTVVRAMSGEGRDALSSCTVESGCSLCFDSVKNGNLYVP